MFSEAPAWVALPDGRSVRLGRIIPKARPQSLLLDKYFDPTAVVTPPPPTLDYSTKALPALRRMYLNDTYGDCVIASKYHQIGLWSGNDLGTPLQGSDAEVLNSYHTICGPGDNGCVMTDVLDYFKSKGLILNGVTHRLDDYVALDTRNKLMVQVAALLFGGIDLGFNVPKAWIDNAKEGAVWDVPVKANFVGGHCIPVVGYNAIGVQVATWALILTVTWRALAQPRIFTEAYAELSSDWYNIDLLNPNGVNSTALKDDLAKMAAGQLPPIDPTPIPPPIPPVPPIPPAPPIGGGWQIASQGPLPTSNVMLAYSASAAPDDPNDIIG